MSTTTTKYGFTKPEKTDPADITATNENWDKLDEALTKHTHDLSMSGHKITDVAEPESRSDVATRGFVEDFSIEGSTYVAVDENKDGNVVLRPFIPDVDDFAIEDTYHRGCYYRNVNGMTEWINPPMILGTEYRTTEKHKGCAVYVMALNGGELPNTTSKNIYIDTEVISEVISLNVVIYDGSFATQLPFINKQGVPAARCYVGTDMYENGLPIVIQTFEDMSKYNATIYVKYIK